jgi:hypothetical protein
VKKLIALAFLICFVCGTIGCGSPTTKSETPKPATTDKKTDK